MFAFAVAVAAVVVAVVAAEMVAVEKSAIGDGQAVVRPLVVELAAV